MPLISAGHVRDVYSSAGLGLGKIDKDMFSLTVSHIGFIQRPFHTNPGIKMIMMMIKLKVQFLISMKQEFKNKRSSV